MSSMYGGIKSNRSFDKEMSAELPGDQDDGQVTLDGSL